MTWCRFCNSRSCSVYFQRTGSTCTLPCVLLMVIAAFAVVIKNLLISTPGAVIPVWGAIVVALLVGVAVYRLRWPLLPVTVVGVVVLYALIVVGDKMPVVLPESMLGMSPATFWILALFVYWAIASLLPVWVLLQPRDYINGVQLFVGLILLFGSVLLATLFSASPPDIVAPAINMNVPDGTPSMIPLLFVTIACGAISGFHGMVASGMEHGLAEGYDKIDDLVAAER